MLGAEQKSTICLFLLDVGPLRVRGIFLGVASATLLTLAPSTARGGPDSDTA